MTPEQKRELEANQFAMALLMPEEMLKKEVKKLSGVTFEEAVKVLAKKFYVTRERMAARLGDLNLIT
ncbi:ImmA/IrrE family metallo-endopeptidase [bacterium]|jgi:Zn-dependent peptidase ImmA (M78 family)|nr:ImmA/IrrE family metallo-endopeptidase [bacterium]